MEECLTVKRDGLIQTRIESLFLSGGGNQISGFFKVKENGKRNFQADMNNPTGAKRSRNMCGWSTGLNE